RVAAIGDAALQEDAQGVAITSYQGGHLEYFTYLRQLLDESGARQVRIYGGGGGVIVPSEIEELQGRGIDRIFSPEDGRRLGLQGMINVVLEGCDFDAADKPLPADADAFQQLARAITLVELGRRRPAIEWANAREARVAAVTNAAPVVGLTGTGGAGKSS